MRIDEAGRHQHAARVDFLRATTGDLADRDDLAAVDRDIRLEWLGAGAIDHRAIADHQFRHRSQPQLGGQAVALSEVLQLLPGGVLYGNAVLAPVPLAIELDLAG